MAKSECNLQINVDNKKFNKQVEKTTKLTESLKKALEELNNIDINVSVTNYGKKKWYQFWK